MPEVYVPAVIKNLVFTRANGNCEYCLIPGDFSAHPFCIDHIVPTSTGGETIESNLALSYPQCNGSKYNKTTGIDPLSKTKVSLFHPRQNLWIDHFVWDETFSIIIGITPCGRATIECMKMNAVKMQNLRKALREYGVFPPDLT